MIVARSIAVACLASMAFAARAQPAPAVPPPIPPTPAAAARVLTLAEALETARAHQPQLQQAHAAWAASAARVDEAFAPLLPQVSASGSYQRTTSNFVPRPGLTAPGVSRGGTSLATTGFWNFGLTASELVYDFGQTTGRWRSAEAAASSQRGNEQATLQQILLTVRATYFNARAGKDLVKVALDTVANQDAHLRQIEGFVRIGTRPEIDLAQVRTDRANAEVQLINAENQYATARAQLNQAMGSDGPADFDVGDETLPAVEGEDQPPDALLDIAIRNRPDLAALRDQARSQELAVGAVRGGYAPSLGVSTGLTEAGPALDGMVWNWNATATLTWNLFQGGLTRAQVREAQANLDAARAQLETARLQVRVDVEQARLAVRASKSALGASGEALVNAQQRLRLAEGRYQAGVGSIIELGDAQVALTAAAAQRVQAQYNLSTSRAQLLRALGSDGAGSSR